MPLNEFLKISVYLDLQGESYHVGQLADNKGSIIFEYDDDFMDRGLELSPIKLPINKKLYVDAGRPEFFQLPGLFYDALPDGWGLLVMDRTFRAAGQEPDRISPLTRLAYLGNRAMGALRFEPEHELYDSEKDKPLDLAEMARESGKILSGETETLLKDIMVAGGSPGGARPKALIGLNTKTDTAIHGAYDIPEEYSHYVVKFRGLSEPESTGAVEYVYAIMAREAGIFMPETRLLSCGEERFFAVKRFDREGNNKIHMHTLGGLLHADFRKPEAEYLHFLKATSHLTKNFQDVLEAYRRMVFNVLAYNRDDHVKNFSFLMDLSGQWQLSPAYDLTYSPGMGGWHTMGLGTSSKDPGKKEFMLVAEKMGIKTKQANEVIQQVSQAVMQWEKYAREYDVAPGVIKKINTLIKQQNKDIN